MRSLMAVIALAIAVSPLVGAGEAHAAKKPRLKQCPVLQPLGRGDIPRTEAVAIPRQMRKIAVATPQQLAISTIRGSTLCIDMRLRGEVGPLGLSPDGRFVSFDWAGYEAAGHLIIDRTGIGQQIDAGSAPVFSPSRRRLVTMGQGSAGDAAIDSLDVWQIDQVGLRRVASVPDLPDLADWRVDRWELEDCVDLSGIPLARVTGRVADIAGGARDRYMATPYGNGWRVVRTTRGCGAG